MQNLFKIISVDQNNLTEHPQAICFMNPKNPDYKIKVGWLQKRFKEGLVIKLLYPSEGKRAVGFIEYTPGEYAWRSVSAAGYMFINCIWVFSNDNKNKGLGSILINECSDDADKKGYLGTAAVASEGSFMAGKDLFIKNKFRIVDERKPSYTLLVKDKKKSKLPEFNDYMKAALKYKGLNILYTNQCPWVARSISEFKEISEERKLNIKFKELKTSKEAQAAPSVYSSFNLIYNGKLLTDHYVSKRRFFNILQENSIL